MMNVLRVYDPWECDIAGVPLDWKYCRTCSPSIDVPLTNEPYNGLRPIAERDMNCTTCNGHGSLRGAALAGRWARSDGPLSPHPTGDPRCEDCGHPMSEGTWEGPAFTSLSEVQQQELDHAWRCLLENIEPTGTIGRADYFSPCDEACRHSGPGRRPFDDGWIGCNELMNNVGITKGFQASWRPVDVRTLGWPHDLRPERLAILCLRCWAKRSSTKTE
jgi:hypothetical protein